MKLRVLRKKVYVSSTAQKGWKAESIDVTKDVLQQWNDEKGWIDIPVQNEYNRIYSNNEFEVESF